VSAPRPAPRSWLAPFTAFGLAFLGWGAWRAWRQASLQGWERLDIGWLALERWQNERAILPALATALAVAALAFLTRRRQDALARTCTRLGHPLLLTVSLVLAFALPGVVARRTRPAAPPGAPNVLFVLVDTWRADHVGFLGYERPVSPNLDRLARRGVVFENAIAQSSWTKPSVATLLTGLLPSKHHAVSQAIPETPVRGFRLNPRLTTFVELLHGKGWQTAMWSDNPNITPPIGFDQGAESFRDYFHEPCHAEDCGRIEEIAGDVRSWFDTTRDETRPFCLYVHVMDAHYPFEPPPEFAGRFDTAPSDLQLTGPVVHDYMTGKRDEARLTPERLKSLIDRYDEELLAVDHHLGALIDEVLREHPDTVVVLSGDHGEEFFEHGNLGHSHALWNELTHVPLVIWGPDVAPGRVPSQVRLMDVAPTLLELVGEAGGLPDVQGQSLVDLMAGRESADRPAPMEVGGDQKPCWQWRGTSDGAWKLLRREADLETLHPIPQIFAGDEGARPRWMLFDLRADPGEQVNLADEHPEEVERLFAELERRGWYVPPERLLGLRASAAELDGVDLDALRRLGYGGDEGEAPTRP
jgi:choline-sulfatase